MYSRRRFSLITILLVLTLWVGPPGRTEAQQPSTETTEDLQKRVQTLEDALRRVEAELARKSEPRDEKKKEEEDRKKKEAESQGVAVGSDLSMKGFWKDGPVLESPNKDFRLHVGGRMNVDFAWFGAGQRLQLGPGGVGELEDGAEFRRARVRLDGAAYEVIEWLAEFDFATAYEGLTTHPGITDLYFDVTQMPVIGNFRVGHFREPFGLEALTSGNALTFMERSNNWDAFVPFRNVGMMLYNTAFDDRMTWAVGVFRTNSRNNGNTFDYGDGEYSSTGRVTVLPWYEQDGAYLLHLGAGFSHRSYNLDSGQEQLRYRSFPGVRVGRYIFADTGSLPAESADLANAEFGLNLGAFSLQAEYFHTWVRDARIQNQDRNPTFHGWYIQASYFLTGEYRAYRRYIGQRTVGVFDRPRLNEDFFFVPLGERGGWRDWCLGKGAWEVALRYSEVDLNDPSQGVKGQTLRDVTLGLNWYLTYNTKIQWNYILADRDYPSRDNHGLAHVFAMRFHHDF